MNFEILGDVMQTVDVKLRAGESVFTESGGMAWMTGDVEMSTNARGGLMAGLGRALAGESLFMTSYICRQGDAQITFTPEVPGKIVPFELKAGESLICQRDSFMVADETVELKVHLQKRLGAGFFGGEGFILQRLTGPGTALVEIPGEVREVDLAEGEVLRVDPGHIAAFQPSVDYDIQRMRGVRNILFSGEGLFLATMKGPGKVWLQSLPLSNLAAKLSRYMPQRRG
ncbi:MAG: TIGR00266 family protein [Chloroflexi bacterium]|nr:MAG: TIGR00266 family protein [Chloroflexota bacterium]MBL1193940.1 TIGR00266 family protein [Chloroflexota bacterium]NOH11234.1 TIGR00266 family protein [Chloroflexota bacterium]